MKKALVAYFSASGVTADAAKKIAAATGAALWEICPAVRYTEADLDWRDSTSRSSIEMKDPTSRPAIQPGDPPVDDCDVIFLGFPIWWYVAPTIVQTFLESIDCAGKTIVLFATSGGSGWGDTAKVLQPSCKGAALIEGRILGKNETEEEIRRWITSLAL